MKLSSTHYPVFIFSMSLLISTSLCAQQAAVSNSITRTADSKELNWSPAPEFFPGCSFTILQGSMDQPNMDFLFKIEPNTEVIKHTHSSAERMILLSGDLEVQYEGEDAVVLKEGAYAYGPAGKPHRAKCLDNGPCMLFVALVGPFDVTPMEGE